MRRIVTLLHLWSYCFFFFNDTATTEIYTLSLHDALPIYAIRAPSAGFSQGWAFLVLESPEERGRFWAARSEEHTSELQSRQYLVCRLLLEKKKDQNRDVHYHIRNRLLCS